MATCQHRLIPARAGNTLCECLPRRLSSAHPRSRGEHVSAKIIAVVRRGSSPLARGTLDNVVRPVWDGRLIPARAGNTERRERSSPSATAHPRSRGEHLRAPIESVKNSGSSPLARGPPARLGSRHALRRLIPARAGNTFAPWHPEDEKAAHPRSRGEHWLGSTKDRHPYGSSPLARGTRPRIRGLSFRLRLIPARAGNTGFLQHW